jgi:ribosome maturation factor RimP
VLSGENPLFNLFLKEVMMEERVKKIIGDSLNDLNLTVDSVIYEKENGHNYLRICLDSPDTIDLDLIVKATNIINPLMDKEDIIKEEYHLDIYGKSKGN